MTGQTSAHTTPWTLRLHSLLRQCWKLLKLYLQHGTCSVRSAFTSCQPLQAALKQPVYEESKVASSHSVCLTLYEPQRSQVK